jgi:hypothetical protein
MSLFSVPMPHAIETAVIQSAGWPSCNDAVAHSDLLFWRAVDGIRLSRVSSPDGDICSMLLAAERLLHQQLSQHPHAEFGHALLCHRGWLARAIVFDLTDEWCDEIRTASERLEVAERGVNAEMQRDLCSRTYDERWRLWRAAKAAWARPAGKDRRPYMPCMRTCRTFPPEQLMS